MSRNAAIQRTEFLMGRFLPEPLFAKSATGKNELPLAGLLILWTPDAGAAHFAVWL
jgi:hypothetical protein